MPDESRAGYELTNLDAPNRKTLQHTRDGNYREEDKPETLPTENSTVRKDGMSSVSLRLTATEDSWLIEILSLALSAGALFGVFAICRRFDNKPQPLWDHITINALIAWLSVFARSAIILVPSRCIGQLKWIWFAEDSRTLYDICLFDSASRGIIGSAHLIWQQKAQ